MEVKIIRLEPMIVASFYAFSESPEEEAFEKMNSWAKPKGLFADSENHPIFGFNNPPPSRPGQKYGYELWINVDPKTEPEKDMRVCFFGGGSYAVARCSGVHAIHDTWMALFEWCKKNTYKTGTHQGLEKHISGNSPENMVLELYCPIYEMEK